MNFSQDNLIVPEGEQKENPGNLEMMQQFWQAIAEGRVTLSGCCRIASKKGGEPYFRKTTD